MKRFLLFFMAIMFFVMQGWTQTPVTLPYSQNFEDTTSISEWTFTSSNSTTTDMWVIGAATGNTGNSMYISSDGGVTNSYSQLSTYTYASALVNFGQAAEFSLSFDWKAVGEIGHDVVSVYAIPSSSPMPTTGYPTGGGGVTLLNPTGHLNQTWQNVNIILPSATFANTTQRLIFVWYSDDLTIANTPVAVDNIVITSSNCVTPTGLAASNITQTSASLAWTEVGTATAWYLYYKEATATNYDSVHVTTNPYILQNLTVNTPYNAYIKADCGSEYSNSSPVVNFRTTCYPITTLPWTENFDSYGTGTGAYPTCWSKINTHSSTMPYIRSTNNYSAPGSLYFQATSVTYNIAITPEIDASFPVNTLMATFYYRNYNANDKLTIGIMTDPTDETTFDSITTIQASTTATWEMFEVNLSSYTGNGRYIAFKNKCNISIARAHIDDLMVDYIPPCPRLTSYVTNITATTADIKWTPSQTDAGCWVYWKKSSETNYDSLYVASNDSSLTLSNLTANSTKYDFYIVRDCGSELFSEASNVYSFYTACGNITTLPFTENFDTYPASTNFPTCWFSLGNSPTFSSTNFSPPYSLNFYRYSTVGTVGIRTQQFDQSIPINSLVANFKLLINRRVDSLYVGVMSDPTIAETFDTVAVISSRFGTSGEWDDVEVNFSNYQGTGKYIAFKREYSGSNYIFLDDLSIDTIPPCARPTQLTFPNITPITAEINWISGHTTDTSWYLYYKEHTATDYDSLYISSKPYTLPNLITNTLYDVYIKTNCGTGILSEPSIIYSFRTACDIISTLPYTENFDTYDRIGGIQIFPVCWTKLSTTPQITSSSTTYPYPYINYNRSHSESYSLYFYDIDTTYSIATLPQIDTSIAVNTLMASFYFLNFNPFYGLTIGVMTDPTDATTFDSITTVSTSTIENWELFEVNFSSYTGNGKYIAFRNKPTSTTSSYFCIDDLTLNYISTCPNIYSLSAKSITNNKITLDWDYNTISTSGWDISYSAVGTGFNPGSGTIIHIPNTILPPYTIPGLSPSTAYSFAVRQACGGTWSNILTIKTMGTPAQLPYNCDFEDTIEQNSWLISNGIAHNKWFIGTAVEATPITGNSLYISNDNGVSNYYSRGGISSILAVVASRLVEFDGSGGYTLTFDSRIGGYYNNDFIKVFLVDPDTTFSGTVAGVVYYGNAAYSTGVVLYNDENGAYFNNMNNPTTVNSHSIEIPYQGMAGTVKKLIFVWVNYQYNYGSTVQPPASIDNISITPISCAPPSLTVSNITQTTANASWTSIAGDSAWWLYLKEESATVYDSVYITGSPLYLFNTLTENTVYNAYIVLDCGSGVLSSPSPIINFRTLCDPITTLPWQENFETYQANTYPPCWSGITPSLTGQRIINSTSHAGTNSLYLYAQGAYSGAYNYNIATTPSFDASIPINTH